jgi:hypothetical protein
MAEPPYQIVNVPGDRAISTIGTPFRVNITQRPIKTVFRRLAERGQGRKMGARAIALDEGSAERALFLLP